VAEALSRRGVEAPIAVVPTGIDIERFSQGDGSRIRKQNDIPNDAFVVGHVGRLAREKNLPFLAASIARFLKGHSNCICLIVGSGNARGEIEEIFQEHGVHDRLRLTGVLKNQELVDAYHAMDVFAFASKSETQGMVLTEAMAAGIPVVAVDASGVREVVRDQQNGRLLSDEDVDEFAAALEWIASLSPQTRRVLENGVAKTAAAFSMSRTAERTLALYQSLIGVEPRRKEIDTSLWASTRRRIEEEWKILGNIAHALGDAVLSLHRAEGPSTTSGKRC
jgi:glycosyltransferase involved in cell wall biosynthesis